MKASSLTRHLIAATLFPLLATGVARTQTNSQEAATNQPVDPAPKTTIVAPSGPGATAATIERVVRAAVAAEPALLRRYDRNQNGKLDDDEWREAKLSIGAALSGGVGLNPKPGDEQRRLEAVTAEVARRRALREKVGQSLETAAANTATESKSGESVAAEIEDRREQREKTEQEAKLLVKDLLEIGMAQRRAYEEARARAAEEEKKKAEDPAKK